MAAAIDVVGAHVGIHGVYGRLLVDGLDLLLGAGAPAEDMWKLVGGDGGDELKQQQHANNNSTAEWKQTATPQV